MRAVFGLTEDVIRWSWGFVSNTGCALEGQRDKGMYSEIISRAKSVWAGSHSPVLNRGCSEEDFQGFRDMSTLR